MHSVDQIRSFNRTVTQYVGALEAGFLGRDRPLGACRVLFEIGEHGIDIRDLRNRLELDSGYVSRLVRGLESDGLVVGAPSKTDARVRALRLTAAGRKELSALNGISDDRADFLMSRLTDKQCEAMLSAMRDVVAMLSASAVEIAVEDPDSRAAIDCMTKYYDELAARFDTGFDPAKSAAAVSGELVPPNGVLLVARLHGRPVGCGALRRRGRIGEIKRMWVDAETRGLGIGRRLLNRLERVASELSIDVLRLETNRALKEAQALYGNSGYRGVKPFNDEAYADHWFEKRIAD